MAVRTLLYSDLTTEQRRRGANKMTQRLLGLINHPFLTVEQRKAIYDKIALIERWEKLMIEQPGPAPSVPHVHSLGHDHAPALPFHRPPDHHPHHHEIIVGETVPTNEKL